MIIWLIAFTKQGGRLCAHLQDRLKGQGHSVQGYCKYETGGITRLTGELRDFTQKAFEKSHAVIFIGAAGIAVRAIAPFIRSKASDPAVIVIDEKGKYVIPILSGHMGGANSLAEAIAGMLEAQAVITTATDMNGNFAVDTWAVNNCCHIMNPEKIKEVSAAILKGEQVGFYCDFPVDGSLPQGLSAITGTRVGICIALQYEQYFEHTLHILPKRYILGVGCKKNIDCDSFESFIQRVLQQNEIWEYEIGAVASIDLKAEEEAILQLSRQWKVPFYTYSAEELSKVPGAFSHSTFVKETTGVGNVCERAAIAAGGTGLAVKKICGEGMTAALAIKDWRCRF